MAEKQPVKFPPNDILSSSSSTCTNSDKIILRPAAVSVSRKLNDDDGIYPINSENEVDSVVFLYAATKVLDLMPTASRSAPELTNTDNDDNDDEDEHKNNSFLVNVMTPVKDSIESQDHDLICFDDLPLDNQGDNFIPDSNDTNEGEDKEEIKESDAGDAEEKKDLDATSMYHSSSDEKSSSDENEYIVSNYFQDPKTQIYRRKLYNLSDYSSEDDEAQVGSSWEKLFRILNKVIPTLPVNKNESESLPQKDDDSKDSEQHEALRNTSSTIDNKSLEETYIQMREEELETRISEEELDNEDIQQTVREIEERLMSTLSLVSSLKKQSMVSLNLNEEEQSEGSTQQGSSQSQTTDTQACELNLEVPTEELYNSEDKTGHIVTPITSKPELNDGKLAATETELRISEAKNVTSQITPLKYGAKTLPFIFEPAPLNRNKKAYQVSEKLKIPERNLKVKKYIINAKDGLEQLPRSTINKASIPDPVPVTSNKLDFLDKVSQRLPIYNGSNFPVRLRNDELLVKISCLNNLLTEETQESLQQEFPFTFLVRVLNLHPLVRKNHKISRGYIAVIRKDAGQLLKELSISRKCDHRVILTKDLILSSPFDSSSKLVIHFHNHKLLTSEE